MCQFCPPFQNPVREDHHVSLGRADWSETEESAAQSVENTPSREAILEDVIEDATKQCLDAAARNGTKTSISQMERNTEMAPPLGDSQTIQVPTCLPMSESFGQSSRPPIPDPLSRLFQEVPLLQRT